MCKASLKVSQLQSHYTLLTWLCHPPPYVLFTWFHPRGLLDEIDNNCSNKQDRKFSPVLFLAKKELFNHPPTQQLLNDVLL